MCKQLACLLLSVFQAKALVREVVDNKVDCLNPTLKTLQVALAATDRNFLYKISGRNEVKQDLELFRPSAVILARLFRNHNRLVKIHSTADIKKHEIPEPPQPEKFPDQERRQYFFCSFHGA